MEDRLVRGILLLILLVTASFFIMVPQIKGQTDLVTVISTSHEGITVVEYKNSEENIFDIKSVVLEVNDGNFKSFKTENGWTGKKTSVDAVTFTSTDSIKPGESAKFGIKTSTPDPVFSWKAFDEEGDELGSGERIVTTQQEITTKKSSPLGPSGVLDDSSFRMIPSTPSVGSSLRIVGEDFGPREKLDFYIDNNKIDSFVTDENGAFTISTKIPESQQADRADFIIRDQNGDQKSMSLRIKEASSRAGPQDVTLTINSDSVNHRGDEKKITGTALPQSTITMSISDSGGNILTTFTATTDSTGKYSITYRVPLDLEFGDYRITVSDGKNVVFNPFTIETTQKITLSSTKQPYEPGETMVLNGTAIVNQEILITIEDPVGMEIYAKSFVVGADGKVSVEYKLDTAAREGTYVVSATQGEEHQTFLVGVGELPEIQLLVRMSALNYKTTDQAVINIIGPPSSTVGLVLVDPSDKQKLTDTITIGPDGSYVYTFSLNGYSPGVYTAVLTRGNAQVEERFSVGLQTNSGPVTIRTVSDTYLPGDSILILGDSSPNVIVTVTLVDPNSVKVRTVDVFTDKKGVFTSSVFRFPSDAQPGIWKLEASSGLNHVTKELTVLAQAAQGLTVHVDKSPPTYSVNEIITISGMGAGKSHNIEIKILGTDKNEISALSIVATGTGGFSTIWKVPTTLNSGTYTIKVLDASTVAETTFNVK